MEEDRYKRKDNQSLLSPIPVNSDSGTFQVIDAETDSESVNGEKNDYREETAAEITAPQPNRMNDTFEKARDRTDGVSFGGTFVGVIAVILSILSLFTMPFLFGILGIIGGFISRNRGAKSMGSWAIGIGVLSIIVGIFILPFF